MNFLDSTPLILWNPQDNSILYVSPRMREYSTMMFGGDPPSDDFEFLEFLKSLTSYAPVQQVISPQLHALSIDEGAAFELESVLQHLTPITSILNENLEYIYLSNSLRHLSSYSVEELRRGAIDELIHPSDIAKLKQAVQEATSDSRRVLLELRFRDPVGTYRWLEVEAIRYKSISGKNRYVCTSRDLTKVQHLRFQSWELHKLAGLGSWRFNLSEKVIHLGRDLRQMLKVDESELDLPDFFDLFEGDFTQAVGQLENDLRDRGEWSSKLRRQGKTYKCFAQVAAIADGKTNTIVGGVYDISKHEETEVRYRRLEQRMGWLLDTMIDSVCVVARDGRIMEEFVRESSGPSMTLQEIYPDHCEELHKLVAKCLDQDSVETLEIQIDFGNDRRFIEIRLQPLGPNLVVMNSRDVTDLREKEFLLLRRRERDFQISKMAMLGEVAAGISHEINNPLAIITGYAGIIGDLSRGKGLSSDQLQKYCSSIENASDRIANIIKLMRSFSKDDNRVRSENYLISQIMSEVMQLVQGRFKHHRISIDIDIAPSLMKKRVKCVYTEVVQAMVALLRNAFDAVVESDRERWVRIEAQHQGDRVALLLSNSGDEISEELVERVFDPFFSAHSDKSGAGLGLSTSRGLIERNGGELVLVQGGFPVTFAIKLALI